MVADKDEIGGERGPRGLAAFLLAVGHGIAVQAKAGFCRTKLEAVAEQALSSWPGA